MEVLIDKNSEVLKSIILACEDSNSFHTKTEVVGDLLLSRMSDMFEDHSAQRKETYVDVPIYKIVGLSRMNDAWEVGDTWEDVMNKRLTGIGWREEVYDYFEDSLKKKEFPSKGARGELSLTSYHGLTVCESGNHRLPAMVCYLAAKYNDFFRLKEASVYLVPFSKKKLDGYREITNGIAKDIKIYINKLTDYEMELFEAKGNRIFSMEEKLYCVHQEGIDMIYEKRESFKDKVYRFFHPLERMQYEKQKGMSIVDVRNEHDKGSWVDVPSELMRKLLNDTWFDEVYGR